MHDQHVVDVDRAHDRREVLHRVVRHLRVDADVDRERRDVAEQQRVAVGRRLGDGVGADHAARAGAVVDDDRLAERLGQRLLHDARIEIDRAARRERHDDADRLRRIRLRVQRAPPRRSASAARSDALAAAWASSAFSVVVERWALI